MFSLDQIYTTLTLYAMISATCLPQKKNGCVRWEAEARLLAASSPTIGCLVGLLPESRTQGGHARSPFYFSRSQLLPSIPLQSNLFTCCNTVAASLHKAHASYSCTFSCALRSGYKSSASPATFFISSFLIQLKSADYRQQQRYKAHVTVNPIWHDINSNFQACSCI